MSSNDNIKRGGGEGHSIADKYISACLPLPNGVDCGRKHRSLYSVHAGLRLELSRQRMESRHAEIWARTSKISNSMKSFSNSQGSSRQLQEMV